MAVVPVFIRFMKNINLDLRRAQLVLMWTLLLMALMPATFATASNPPTTIPTTLPTRAPSPMPSASPTSRAPTVLPTVIPSATPTISCSAGTYNSGCVCVLASAGSYTSTTTAAQAAICASSVYAGAAICQSTQGSHFD
jgi:hypothetical protein